MDQCRKFGEGTRTWNSCPASEERGLRELNQELSMVVWCGRARGQELWSEV